MLIRHIPLQRYLAVMSHRGVDSSQLLRRAGLEIVAVDDLTSLIEVDDYLRVVEDVIALAGDEGIGLDMGLSREIGDFRILGHAAMTCLTVRQAMKDYWAPFGEVMGMMARIDLADGDADTVLGKIVAVRASETSHRFFVEEALCVLMKLGEQVNGARPEFRAIHLAYSEPSYATRYRELFRCPVHFGALTTSVTLSRDWLDKTLDANDPELLGIFQRSLLQTRKEIETSASLGTKVRHLFTKNGGHPPALDDAARALGLSPRTFRRRLLDEGLTYRAMTDLHRKDFVMAQLRSGNRNAKRLGAMVGFDDVNAFRRAFKRWNGATVSATARSHHSDWLS